jgi:hypothetical protein
MAVGRRRVPRSTRQTSPEFVEVRVPRSAVRPVQIQLRNGRAIRVDIGSDAREFAMLLDLVEGSVC